MDSGAQDSNMLPVTSRMLYFDHNATHPLSPTARAAWLDAVDRYPANPSSPHRLGARAEAALAEAREKLAAGWGARRRI